MKHSTQKDKIIPILYVHYGDEWIRGSERCLLDLLTHLDKTVFEPILWCNSKVLMQEAQALGIKVYHDNFKLLLGWRRPKLDLPAFYTQVKRASKLIDQHRIQLIHANSGAPCQWLNLAARIHRIPLIAHLHARYPWRDRVTLGLHQAPYVVGVSRPVVDSLAQDQVRDGSLQVIANGIDITRLEQQGSVDIRERLGINQSDYVIATIGSLIKRKGMDLLIDALADLVAQEIPAHLVIIGSGPEAFNLLHQARELKVSKHLHLLGEQDTPYALIRDGVDVFASGAREEVFGLVLAEAGLAGLPVVATNVGGIPEVVVDSYTGLLVEPESSEALSRALGQLFLAPCSRKELGLSAHHHVKKHFSIQRNVSLFQSLYHQVLSQGSAHPHLLSHWHLTDFFRLISKQMVKMIKRNVIAGARS